MQEYGDSFWRRNRLPFLLAAFYIVLLTPMMGRKNGYTVDATPSYQLTKTIVSSGDFFPPNLRVKQGYIYSIAYLPFYALGDALAAVDPSLDADWTCRKCMCWMNTVIAALTLAVLSLAVRRLGYSKGAQIVVPLLYGCSTMAFNYARYDYNKCLAGLLLLAGFYAALRFVDTKRIREALFCGTALGLLVSLRLELAVVAPALAWTLLRVDGSTAERTKRIAAFALPFIAGIGWVFIYNSMYWSGGASGGYEEGFGWNPIPGLLGFLGSPGKNIWIFNPILLFLPLFVRPFSARRFDVFLSWVGVVVPVFVLYCFWGNWWGGWGWGPRHLVPLLPFLVLPMAAAIDSTSRLVRWALAGLFALGIFVQFLGSIVDFNDIIMTLMGNEITEPELIWNPVWNAVLQHGAFFAHAPIARWDIGWMGVKNHLSFPVFLGMLIAWIGSLAALLAVMARTPGGLSDDRST